jgi:hypothetical protein
MSVSCHEVWTPAYLVDGPLAGRRSLAPVNEDGQPVYRHWFADDAGRSFPYEFALLESGGQCRAVYYLSDPPDRLPDFKPSVAGRRGNSGCPDCPVTEPANTRSRRD